jgi:hypothetical protein
VRRASPGDRRIGWEPAYTAALARVGSFGYAGVMWLFLVFGCHEYGVGGIGAANEGPAPRLVVDPLRVVFDPVPLGESDVRTVTLSNEGAATLTVSDLTLTGSGAFAVGAELPLQIAAGESVTLDVAFSPVDPQSAGELHVGSDDPAQERVVVDLSGSGLFPEVTIAPELHDFGRMPPSCERQQPITISSTGDVDLVVDGAVAAGSGYALDGLPPLPVRLAPGESLVGMLTFTNGSFGTHPGRVQVSTDAGTATATQTAQVIDRGHFVDVFDAKYAGATDVLIYVDQSGSMSDDQANLIANIDAFAAALDALSTDWLVMVANADDGCHAAMVDPWQAGWQEAFAAAVHSGGGQYTEAGLTVARNALDEARPGGCNEGFLREYAKVLVVLISDEPEQSPEPWSDLVDDMLAIAPGAAISAVAGPVPGGCPSANPGTGYHEAVLATEGAFLAICDSDWGENLEVIAATTGASPYGFELSATPDPETLEVRVDDALRADWTYDEARNAVVFAPRTFPEGTYEVTVSYDGVATCGG